MPDTPQDRQASDLVITDEMVSAGAYRLYELAGADGQDSSLTLDECRWLIRESLSAAGSRMGSAVSDP